MEKSLQILYQLLEEEISQYQLLLEEIKKESAYLRQRSPEGLIKSVRSLEEHAAVILKLNEGIKIGIETILNSFGKAGQEKTLTGLTAILPSQEARKIKAYQSTLKKLKEWVSQVNNRNKTFIKESLAYWRDLFSLLTQPQGESPVYLSSGQRRSFILPPQSLNRKV
jgi:flagellar biosynthesis/type III secretory pathway chaperone